MKKNRETIKSPESGLNFPMPSCDNPLRKFAPSLTKSKLARTLSTIFQFAKGNRAETILSRNSVSMNRKPLTRLQGKAAMRS